MSGSRHYRVGPEIKEDNDANIKVNSSVVVSTSGYSAPNSSGNNATLAAADDDDETRGLGPPPKGCIEVILRIRELELETIYSDWTNWMHKFLQFYGLFNIILYYQLDRGGEYLACLVLHGPCPSYQHSCRSSGG